MSEPLCSSTIPLILLPLIPLHHSSLSSLSQAHPCHDLARLAITSSRIPLSQSKKSSKQKMPIPIIGEIVFKGFDSVPYAWTAIGLLPWAFAVYALRWFFGGTTNTNDRVMHGRVALVTVCIFSSICTSISDDLSNICNYRVVQPALVKLSLMT